MGGNEDDRRAAGPGLRETDRLCGCFLRKLGATNDRSRRLHILKACARLDPLWAEKVLWESLGDPCEEVRDYLVRVLAGRPAVRLEFAAARLARPPWYAKSSALRVFSLRKAAPTLPVIAGVLADPNVEVRRMAVRALGEIGGKGAVPLLLKMKRDENPYVRAEAVAYLDTLVDLKFS